MPYLQLVNPRRAMKEFVCVCTMSFSGLSQILCYFQMGTNEEHNEAITHRLLQPGTTESRPPAHHAPSYALLLYAATTTRPSHIYISHLASLVITAFNPLAVAAGAR